MEMDFLASGNSFFLWGETVLEISGGQVLKKDSILTIEQIITIFSKNSQLVPVETVFPSTGTYFWGFLPFQFVETNILSAGNSIFLFRFFVRLLVETIIEIWEKSVFKDEPYS